MGYCLFRQLIKLVTGNSNIYSFNVRSAFRFLNDGQSYKAMIAVTCLPGQTPHDAYTHSPIENNNPTGRTLVAELHHEAKSYLTAGLVWMGTLMAKICVTISEDIFI